jgi:glucokinase
MQNPQLVGVDIGGTKITAGLVENGLVAKSFTVSTEPEKQKDEILNNLLNAINKVITPATKSIGIGVPGIIDDKNGIICELNNIPSWKNFPLKQSVEKRFQIPVFVNNDANCFILGSKYFGEAKNYSNVVGITLGTGVGSGVLVNGKLYSGAENGAGEFGQIPYKDSIFEEYCCGQFFNKIKKVDGEKLFSIAKNADESALKIWEELGINLGELVKIVIFSFAPEIIVFGGSVSKGFCFFEPALQKSLSQLKLRRVTDQLKITCDLNPNSPVLGAAALYFDNYSM